MSGLTCPHCEKKIDLFKKGGGEKTAQEMDVPFLGRVPIDPNIVHSSDTGKPFILENPDSEASKSLISIIDKIIDFSNKRADRTM